MPPDSIPPAVTSGESSYDGFARLGFRVPFAVVSPWARRHHVSHVVYDHTSILKLVETKWNLPALTYRDANANAPLDMLDLRHGDQPRRELTSAPRGCRPTGTASANPNPPGTARHGGQRYRASGNRPSIPSQSLELKHVLFFGRLHQTRSTGLDLQDGAGGQ